MSSIIVISDDDNDSPPFTDNNCYKFVNKELPKVNVKKKRQEIIRNLFPNVKTNNVASTSNIVKEETIQSTKELMHTKIIGGVEVTLPVIPYECQHAVISQVIQSIKTCKNCLVESPTGTGKTLALLCAALAWQRKAENDISEYQAKEHLANHPQLNQLNGAKEYIATPVKNNIESPEKFFTKQTHGERSIYDPPMQEQSPSHSKCVDKRALNSPTSDNPDSSYVNIHKKQRFNTDIPDLSSVRLYPDLQETPQKQQNDEMKTPEKIALPVIYYGTRTHKQIEQVIKEFRRTVYCRNLTMSILSSRDYTCVREFDKKQWASKNDMCRGCTKTFSARDGANSESNCKYYNNRKALKREKLPAAFDLNDLVSTGMKLTACPFYGARELATNANIIFCPYNYLVDPAIRKSMQINLKDNIVIIDEGHNIEDICRNTATFDVSNAQVLSAIKELTAVASFRFANQFLIDHIENLLKILKDWDLWFGNQVPLLQREAVADDELLLVWNMQSFVDTLDNHNIGINQYNEFSTSVTEFSKKLRDDPRSLIGVTQLTGNLLESLDTALGYLFLNSSKYLNDFKPVLVVKMNDRNKKRWRTSEIDKQIKKEMVTLRLICLNPAVIFESLHTARCIVLASGTLTPTVSLKSELNTDFPLKISPKHIVPEKNLWVGSLSEACGARLECTRSGRRAPALQDALGRAVLRVCARAPHGVLAFLPSYSYVAALVSRWKQSDIWEELEELKHIFIERNDVKEHEIIMKDYVRRAETGRGALLLAVYRGKVAEGMDFRDRQARAVVAIGVPFPNKGDIAVKEKMIYNNNNKTKELLSGNEWFRVQAYRALNQALGRCVRHAADWGAVLLLDARYRQRAFQQDLSAWVRRALGNNHHNLESLEDGPNSLKDFMERMKIQDT